MRHAIFPGTFDPFTLGHLDITERACALFDRVTILLARNSRKSALLPLEERLAVIQASVAHLPGVSVDSHSGLLVEYAGKHGATTLVRGLRAVEDFDFEARLAQVNRRLSPGLDTVFLLAAESHVYLNSTIVRELYLYGDEYLRFVPAPVGAAMQALKAREGDRP